MAIFFNASLYKAFRQVETLFVQGRNLVPSRLGISWLKVNKPCQPKTSLLGTRFLPWTNKVSTCRMALLENFLTKSNKSAYFILVFFIQIDFDWYKFSFSASDFWFIRINLVVLYQSPIDGYKFILCNMYYQNVVPTFFLIKLSFDHTVMS